MSVSDPIADMLTRIRNAVMMSHTNVALPNSKIKVAIAKKATSPILKLSMGKFQSTKCCGYA
jgi:hypothetical protein